MEEIIIKYITKEKISKKELDSLILWLEKPENKKQFKEILSTNQQLDYQYKEVNLELAYKKINKTIKQDRKVFPIFKYKNVYKYAAVFILFLSLSFIVYNNLMKKENFDNEITIEVDGIVNLIDVNKSNTVTNNEDELLATFNNDILEINDDNIKFSNINVKLNVPNSRRIKIKLTDGSLVTMNSGSTLNFPFIFPNNKRNVELHGEAFFDVNKNKEAPFTVLTRDMNVRVLGTRFNVSSYDNDERSFVSLEEGSVAVNRPSQEYNKEQSIIIKPDQQVAVENNAFKIKQTNISKDIAWIKGRLFFKNDRFEDIIKRLERFYNISIENNSKELNDIRYTGTFEEETLEEILITFKELSSFNYQISNDKIVISN